MKAKRSQVGLITVVLIILLVLAAIVVVWNVVYGLIKKSSEDVRIDTFQNTIEVSEVKFVDSFAQVRVKRLSGEANITGLKFIFYDSSGASSIIERTDNMLGVLESKEYKINEREINLNEKKIVKVVVVPEFGKKLGLESSVDSIKDTRNRFYNGGAETGNISNWNFASVSTEAHSGNYSFYEVGGNSKTVYSNNMIEIDPSKTYYEEGWFKSNGAVKSRIYFGFIPFDKDKRAILSQNVIVVPNTQTTLYETCKSGDKIVKITNGANWVPLSYNSIAFYIDDSGNYSDLPNFNLSNLGITKITSKTGYWEVEFGTSVGFNAPAGTKIRQHSAGGTYMYHCARGFEVPNTWTRYNATISGISKNVEDVYSPVGTWRKGTKYVQAMILPNYQQDSNSTLLVDDIKFVELE